MAIKKNADLGVICFGPKALNYMMFGKKTHIF
jgi:hypothetical protein